MSTLEIRKATAAELDALAPLLAPLPLFTAYNLTAEKLAARWRSGLEKGDGLEIAFDGSQPMGMCWYLPRGVFGTGGYLRTLAVVPTAHSKGIGAQLLRAFEEGCNRPSGGWFLLTSDFNEGAQRFYQRHGYTEVGRMPPGFAAPGIGEVIFWKATPRP